MFGGGDRRKKNSRGSSRGGGSASSSSGGAAAASSIDPKAVSDLFDRFRDPEDVDSMTMEGIAALAGELGLDPETDVRVLVLAWKLKAAAKPGEIARSEFQEGMQAFGVDTIEGLQQQLPTLDPGFLEQREFREFYRFCFQFHREGTQRTIEKDLIIQLMPLAICGRSVFLDDFLEFLPSNPVTRITADQWNSFLEFSHTVSEDLTGYEEDSAWPLLLDEFVEWRRTKEAK